MRISDWSSDVCSSDLAALPVGYPLCEEEVITPENASPYPFIALSRWQATNFRVARVFDNNRQRRNVAVECELFSTALLLVSEGAGVTLAALISAAALEQTVKVGIRRFETEISYAVLRYNQYDPHRTSDERRDGKECECSCRLWWCTDK